MSKYINLETSWEWSGSTTACALLLPLTLMCNKDNEINKKDFTNKLVDWIKDSRTWNKYWNELEEAGIIVQIDEDTWMMSPHECYSPDANHNVLLQKWDEVCHAAK